MAFGVNRESEAGVVRQCWSFSVRDPSTYTAPQGFVFQGLTPGFMGSGFRDRRTKTSSKPKTLKALNISPPITSEIFFESLLLVHLLEGLIRF